MDFVPGFPKGRKGNDVIWVIIDRLTKSTLFLPIKMTDSIDKLAKIYINEVVRLHEILVSIVSDRDPRFTSRLWPSIQHAFGDKTGHEHCVSPSNRWPIKKSHPSLGRPITGMCARIWRKLGEIHNICGVHV